MKHNTFNPRRNFIKKLGATALIPFTTPFSEKSDVVDDRLPSSLKKMKKIDLHTHISSDADYLREVMNEFNLKMFTICNEGLKSDRLDAQVNIAIDICSQNPRYYDWCTTFDLNGINDEGWREETIGFLDYSFNHGALAVKVWKEIGMQLKDREGNFIQIDNPVFDPILKYVTERGKTLFAHIGDPVQWWLNTGADGKPDAWYRKDGGAWNRLGKFRGEVPYERLMQARDHMLASHPDLKVIGCHMGSMSFDLDVLADRMEQFPNFAVETSYSSQYLKGQSRNKVRDFFIEYQDRVLYGSDISGGLIDTPFLIDMAKIDQRLTTSEIGEHKTALRKQYLNDLNYFGTYNKIKHRDYMIKGLDLNEEVLKKLFYKNALRWVPGIGDSF